MSDYIVQAFGKYGIGGKLKWIIEKEISIY